MPSHELRDAETTLAAAFCAGREKFQADHPGYTLIITCTHRSIAEQQVLYAQGRTAPGQKVTNVDGVTTKSNHNYDPSRAIDFAVVFNGKVTWSEEPYKLAGPYFVAEGLAWGGDWKSFKDYPHVELRS